MAASLDDMIAWERHIDATRDDPASLYGRLTGPVAFADGAPAAYGFGLGRSTEFGRAETGHGGALRGWRSHRFHCAADRVSVVVMFNHLANAHGAARDLLGAVLNAETPSAATSLPTPPWLGAYIEPETGLAVRIAAGPEGRVSLRFGHGAETLDLLEDGSAGTGEATRLRSDEGGLTMHRPSENLASPLLPLNGAPGVDVAGHYQCAELQAGLTVVDTGGVLYGAYCGFLGQSRMEMLEPIGPDVWALPCPRALDHTPPGDWTLAFRRDASGAVSGVRVGCWLARGLDYERVSRG